MASTFLDPLAPSTCDQCGNATEDTILVKDNKSLCRDCLQDLPEGSREDIGDPEWVCDKHLDRKVEVFCKTCNCGSCKDCTVDCSHKGHDVVCVLQLEEEKRRYLWKLHKEVSARVENLPKLQLKIWGSMTKIEEDRIFMDRFFNEMKKEITRKEEDEIGRINSKIDHKIAVLELERYIRRHEVSRKFDIQMQTADEYHRRMKNVLILEDEERRKQKIQEAGSKLLDSQQALEVTIEQVEKMLESTPEKLLHSGKPLSQVSSLAKVTLEFQSEEDVINDCMEAEANIPNLKEKKDFEFNRFRIPPYMKYVLCYWLILLCVIFALKGFRFALIVDLIQTLAFCAFGTFVFEFFLSTIICCLLTMILVMKHVKIEFDMDLVQESLTISKLTAPFRASIQACILVISLLLMGTLYVSLGFSRNVD